MTAGFDLRRSMMEPCLWTYYDPQRHPQGSILCHVDDFILAGNTKHAGWGQLVERIRKMYEWGSWESGEDGVV